VQPQSPGSKLVGKRIVVGLNMARTDGTLIEKRQFHGVITEADDEGVVIRQANGEERTFPPAWHAYVPAQSGTYRLRSTGEEVEDPDLETIWTVWGPGTPDEWWEVVSGRGKSDKNGAAQQSVPAEGAARPDEPER
jgi:hypothetical protein